ncbi:isochorismatase family protein [Streptomyces sp. NPDC017524]|uniref:isochorismatase family protein n=1 Tax=unclassified Streptomyces TaxID=2593676 RepID=UPI0037A810FD
MPERAEAAARAHKVIGKTGYTLFTPGADELIRQADWTDLALCGVATESCVLKSAADAFERDHAPWIVTDACATEAGPDVHDVGLVVARRLIGSSQLVTTDHVVRQLAVYPGASVLE